MNCEVGRNEPNGRGSGNFIQGWWAGNRGVGRVRTHDHMWQANGTGVKANVARAVALWNGCAGAGEIGGVLYARHQQRQREAAYDRGIAEVEGAVRARPRTRAERAGVEQQLTAAFGRFATTALGMEDDAVRMITDEFIPVGTELARWTRRFDPEMSKMDIVQACRNAWTACGLQPLMGCRTELTPSILAYSLMYPYSDNYLDRGDVSGRAKAEFSARFRERLQGEVPEPENAREAALWTLVGMVEDEYPRGMYPEVYGSLLAIHAAQERSIAQLKNGATDTEVLEISCEKGGTSVLADAMLATRKAERSGSAVRV